jgi:hypothetical protein
LASGLFRAGASPTRISNSPAAFVRDCFGIVTRRNKGPAAVKKRATTRLTGILRTVEAFYGKPAPPEVTDPLEQIRIRRGESARSRRRCPLRHRRWR